MQLPTDIDDCLTFNVYHHLLSVTGCDVVIKWSGQLAGVGLGEGLYSSDVNEHLISFYNK